MAGKAISPSSPDEVNPEEASKVTSAEAESSIDAAAEAELGDEDKNGVVTCLHEDDMPMLRDAMAAPPQQIQRAAISPLPVQLEEFATLLPRTTSQAHVFEIFPVISTTSPDYYVPSFGAPLKLAERLADIERLTIGERWLLGNAPVNIRDLEVLKAFNTFVEHYSIDESLKVTQWINAQNMSGMLQDYRKAADAYAAAKKALGGGEDVEVTRLPDEVVEFASGMHLIRLESLHRCLGLYLWLHNRYALRFPQAAEARLFKNEVQDAIDFVLQHMSPSAKAAMERETKRMAAVMRSKR